MSSSLSRLFHSLPIASFFAVGILAPSLAHEVRADEAGQMSKDVRIMATEFNFTPNVIKVNTGSPIHLTLDNSRGETEHVVTITALGKRIFASSGAKNSETVVFDRAGEYEFVCDLPGHAEGGMKGKFIVLPDSGSTASLSAIGQE